MAWMHGTAAQKPKDTIKRIKGRADRAEAKVTKAVRAACVDRDGYCRCGKDRLEAAWKTCSIAEAYSIIKGCDGLSEWAHLEDTRRARTRKMRPDLRHHTAGTMMLCTLHHQRYDARTLRIQFLSSAGADGEVSFS